MSDNFLVTDDINENKEVYCPKCEAKYANVELGIYVCPKCGYQEKSEFGVLRTYLEEHEGATVSEISQGTGIAVNKITSYLEKGRIQIKEGSKYFMKCQKCGTDIKSGRYCRNCATNVFSEISEAITEGQIGDKPKSKIDGKMRFIGK